MITILAEKPSVAREIARIVGAMKREEGYFTGNGYHVTWALGHLVQLAMPDGYGIRGFQRDSLPVLPERFELIPRQVKTDKGYKADAAAVKQIKVITKLWNESDGIIVATDCAREGELIFRYLYSYIGCTLPFQRLWISSLTDAAIRKGLKELKDGREYDNLYFAAKARSEADWLVGINGTQALSVAAGRGTYSVGRVQTPTLAMVCQRFWENKRFQPEPIHQLHFTTPSLVLSNVGDVERGEINECSWGMGGYSDSWLDSNTSWVYRHTHKAIERMEELAVRFPDQKSLKGRFLNQAAREVLLAMASDWPYILHDRTSVIYAEKRLRNHLGSFNLAYTNMCRNSVHTEWLIKAEKRNSIFPEMDYNIFNPQRAEK